jgi:Asp-tRNA(Asn)/Glu-tRNA(Gln) amidotransferase C subunit
MQKLQVRNSGVKRLQYRQGKLSIMEFFNLDNLEEQVPMTDAQVLKYVETSSKLAHIAFADEAEKLEFKSDFQRALAFVQKLNVVDIEGWDPLGNVIDFYGGNQEVMTVGDPQLVEDFPQKLRGINKNMSGYLVKTPKPFHV